MSDPTNEEVTTLHQLLSYDPETGLFTWKESPTPSTKKGDKAGYKNNRGYLIIGLKWKRYSGHRLAWLMHYGENPDGEIDHINQNKLDNRIANLRVVEHAINSRNTPKRKRNKSGFTGVAWHKHNKRWNAYIRVDGKMHHLGSFTSLQDAVSARSEAEIKFGFHCNHGKAIANAKQREE